MLEINGIDYTRELCGNEMWRVSARNLPDRIIFASSFDEAIQKAREIDEGYCAGQIECSAGRFVYYAGSN